MSTETETTFFGGDISAWEHLIDECFGEARSLLKHATALDDGSDVHRSVALADAWRELGAAWIARQANEAELNAGLMEDTG